eukprot:2582442-Pleurochrysis_carterae.AAC.10
MKLVNASTTVTDNWCSVCCRRDISFDLNVKVKHLLGNAQFRSSKRVESDVVSIVLCACLFRYSLGIWDVRAHFSKVFAGVPARRASLAILQPSCTVDAFPLTNSPARITCESQSQMLTMWRSHSARQREHPMCQREQGGGGGRAEGDGGKPRRNELSDVQRLCRACKGSAVDSATSHAQIKNDAPAPAFSITVSVTGPPARQAVFQQKLTVPAAY